MSVMQKVRWTAFGLGIVIVGTLGAVLVFPSSRVLLIGAVRQEPFEEGKPASYWIAALKDPDPEIRQQAASLLGRMGPEVDGAAAALAEALADESTHVRVNSALALYKFGPAARVAVRPLALCLKDENMYVRLDAAMSLRNLGTEARSVTAELVAALQEADNGTPMPFFAHGVNQVVAGALGRIGPEARAAVPRLVELFKASTKESLLRFETGEALKSIDPTAAAKAGVP
jgi:HEAT repeat protein